MYGWTVIAFLVFVVSYPMQSTGSSRSSFSRSVVSRLEDIRRPRGSSQTPNCSENDSAVSVRCHPKPSREQSNRSTCCSFGLHNSSHFRNPCAVADQGMSSAQQHTPQRSSPSDCLLRIPAGRRKRPLVVYDLLSCEGSTLRLVCEVNVSCSDQGVSWKKEGRTFAGRELRLQNVQRKDSGTYLCEVMDYYGRPRLGAQVTVAVQFPPVILVPKPPQSPVRQGDALECASEASPSASIAWYRDDVLLDDQSGHVISSETSLCTTRSKLLFLDANVTISHNYTCVASNQHGKSAVTMLLPSTSSESPTEEATVEKRRFNVTGFIVGMLPPLFISFYIILKLGYRSRYAEERGEDDGFRDEPFFISY